MIRALAGKLRSLSFLRKGGRTVLGTMIGILRLFNALRRRDWAIAPAVSQKAVYGPSAVTCEPPSIAV